VIVLPVGFTLAQVLSASSSVPATTVTAEPYASRITAALTLLDRAAGIVNRRGQVRVTSMLRSTQRNEAVGGAQHSHHLTGYAVDFEIPGVSHDVIFEALKSVPDMLAPFDELAVYDDHLHLSADPRGRRKVLDFRTRDNDATGNRTGSATLAPLVMLVLLVLALYAVSVSQ
jgi:hypothetical protein